MDNSLFSNLTLKYLNMLPSLSHSSSRLDESTVCILLGGFCCGYSFASGCNGWIFVGMMEEPTRPTA
jgi:hypothetical protein